MVAMLYESLVYRQVFMDGRQLPADPNPSFMGYSVGRWEGDTLVIDSLGFNETTWLDYGGHPHTEALRTTERIKRGSFGRLDIEVRLDDPQIYKRAFPVPVHAELVADTEMLDYVCNENEKDAAHIVGKASDEKKPAVKVAPYILSKHVGSYTFQAPDDTTHVSHFNVTLTGDTLSMDIGGKDKQEMVAVRDDVAVMGVRSISFRTISSSTS